MQSYPPSPIPQYWSPMWAVPPVPLPPGQYTHSPLAMTPIGTPIMKTEPTHNRAPLPEEENALRQILATKQKLAAHLDGLISEAADTANTLEKPYQDLKQMYESAEAAYIAGQQYIAELIRVKQSMQPAMNSIRSLLHPIRRYPSDILSLVFIAAVESEHTYDWTLESDHLQGIPPRYKRRHAALDISHVCRGWRALAHSTPEMWSTVRINLSRRSSAANKLALFARHAKAVPLNVIIHRLQPSFFPTYASADSDDEDVNTPLFDSVNYLRSLEVHFNHFRALSCLYKLGMSKIEHLEELSLRSDPVMLPTTPDFSLTDYLVTAKNLKKLTLTHISLAIPFHNPNVILSTVTHLIVQAPLNSDAGFVSLPHYLTMLPNLVKLVYFQNDNITAASMGMVEMPMLESVTTNFLALTNAFITSFSAGRVNAPNLRKLLLYSEGQDTSVPLDAFLASNPSLRKLNIQAEYDPIPTTGPHILFRNASTLHTLILSKTCRKFVEILSAVDDDGSPLVLPFLSRLKIECARTWSVTMNNEEVEQLFKARCIVSQGENLTCIGAKQLRHLTLVTHDGISESTRAAIESMMKCARHFDNERLLLFRWHADKTGAGSRDDEIGDYVSSPQPEILEDGSLNLS